jgi:superfamily II DNA or RNA helicase
LLACIRANLEIVDETMRALGGPAPFPHPELRPYQETALNAWDAAHRRGVLVLPTGSGKTRIAIAAIARLAVRTLVIVPTRVLIEQWRAALFAAGARNVGRYGDNYHEATAITVATIESAWRHMPHLGDAFELLIIDEVHRCGGSARSEALEMSLAPFRLGLTATLPPPEDAASARIARLVGPAVHTLCIDDLAGQYLAPYDLVVVDVQLTRSERDSYDRAMQIFRMWADDQSFVEQELSFEQLARLAYRTEEGRAAFVAFRTAQRLLAYPREKREALRRLLVEHRERKILVFTSENRTAYDVAKEFLIPAITCDVTRGERANILERFRDGPVRAIVSSQVLNEGVDVPDADVAIVLGGRAGEREHIQRIGRVLRRVVGKRALVLELVVPHSMEARAGRRRRGAIARSASRDMQSEGT